MLDLFFALVMEQNCDSRADDQSFGIQFSLRSKFVGINASAASRIGRGSGVDWSGMMRYGLLSNSILFQTRLSDGSFIRHSFAR